jgi:hypothetical protein
MSLVRNTTGSPRTLLGESIRVDIPAEGAVSIDAKILGVLKQNKHVRALFEIGYLEDVSESKPKGKSKGKQKDVGI